MKLLSMIAAAAVAVSLAPTVQAADLTGTLAKIDKSGEIVIGHRESSVPFAYLDENQKPIDYSNGFVCEDCRRRFRRIGQAAQR